MLTDSITRRIDAKGRLSIPPGVIEKLVSDPKADLVLMCLDRCIEIISPERWQAIQKILDPAGNEFNPDLRDLQRDLASQVQVCERDPQGRVRISAAMKEFAGIGDEVRIIGTFNRIELWDPARHDAWRQSRPGVGEQLARLFGGRP